MLGVSRDASAEQIRAAYRRLARQHHPDLNAGSDATRFRVINQAYRSLTGGGWEAPGDAAPAPPPSASERPQPAPERPPPERPPPERPEPADWPEPAAPSQPGTSPLAAASILVPLAVVICAPGPLLLCGVLLAPVGAVLGHVARWQAKRDGRPGSGLALVGIAAGWAVTTVLVVAIGVGVLVSRGQ